MSLGAGRGRKRRSRNSESRASCAGNVSPGTEAEVRRRRSGDSALGTDSARPGWQRADGGQSPRVQAALDSVGRVSPSEGSGSVPHPLTRSRESASQLRVGTADSPAPLRSDPFRQSIPSHVPCPTSWAAPAPPLQRLRCRRGNVPTDPSDRPIGDPRRPRIWLGSGLEAERL